MTAKGKDTKLSPSGMSWKSWQKDWVLGLLHFNQKLSAEWRRRKNKKVIGRWKMSERVQNSDFSFGACDRCRLTNERMSELGKLSER